jgi:GntR family transcriptional regulator/MocR family aminotransferase
MMTEVITEKRMFKHAQLETVKAWMMDPANGSLPLHERIQRAIRALILEGILSHGKALPASRALAISLNVSRDTIEAAYTRLHAEGFIERHTGKGSFVSASARFLKSHSRQRQSAAEVREPTLSARGNVMYKSGGIREFSSPRPLAPGIPETRLFPVQTWERLERQVLKEYRHRALEQSPPQGTERLRRAIAEYVNLERGAHATPERIIILTSSQQALALCSHVLMDSGDAIVIEDPTYQGAQKAFKAAGLNSLPVPLDEKGLCIASLNALTAPAKAIYLTLPISILPASPCLLTDGWRSSTGQTVTRPGLLKMTMTVSFTMKASRWPACRGWMPLTGQSISGRSPSLFFRGYALPG